MSKKLQQGFTLVEIMIVVAIIGILAGIAIPNFIKNRNESQKRACVSNMRQIETAIENYRTANNMNMPSTMDDIVGPDNYIKKAPQCPAGTAAYTIPTTADDGSFSVVCPVKPAEHYLYAAGSN